MITLIISSLFIDESGMKIILNDNPYDLRESIIKIIPPGTGIEKAGDVMAINGFTCSVLRDSSFAGSDRVYEHIDFLYCSIEKGFPVSRRWQAAMVLKNSAVAEVYVSTGLTGP